jgi:hypothetical protein
VIRPFGLAPRNDVAAVTITLTDFPGLYVRRGSKRTEAFPRCDCDACDEQLTSARMTFARS